ncbi:MAG TPA: RNA 2',3'-cyclic phosphodiesterase, partial [Dehalococcoidia bacterium]|nr:RNA 2',3'-cyclic phosphodiesterase [Dehalococcoidia bacterium]
FLGNIVPPTIPQIIEAVSMVAQEMPPLYLQVGGLGAFPNLKRPQVVWVGIGGEIEKLAALQRGIDAALSPLGFPPESRSFSPHLTLGRLRDRITLGERQDFAKWISSFVFEKGLSFEVGDVKLMKSQLTPQGAIYSQLANVMLGS